jgi:hypothetical protein
MDLYENLIDEHVGAATIASVFQYDNPFIAIRRFDGKGRGVVSSIVADAIV